MQDPLFACHVLSIVLLERTQILQVTDIVSVYFSLGRTIALFVPFTGSVKQSLHHLPQAPLPVIPTAAPKACICVHVSNYVMCLKKVQWGGGEGGSWTEREGEREGGRKWGKEGGRQEWVDTELGATESKGRLGRGQSTDFFVDSYRRSSNSFLVHWRAMPASESDLAGSFSLTVRWAFNKEGCSFSVRA